MRFRIDVAKTNLAKAILDTADLQRPGDILNGVDVVQEQLPQFSFDHLAPLLDILFALLLAEPVADLAARAGAAGVAQ